MKRNGKKSILKIRLDAAAHFFRQGSGDGEPETGGAFPAFYREETIKEASCRQFVQRVSLIAESDGTIRGKCDGQIVVAVFYGVVHQVSEDAHKSLPV